MIQVLVLILKNVFALFAIFTLPLSHCVWHVQPLFGL